VRRHELTDEAWARIEPLLPRDTGRPSSRGDRNFVNAVLWIAKTGAPWRDLPERFGSWKTIYNRFHRWANRDIWRDIFRALTIADEELAGLMDSSVVRAHQDAAGGQGGPKKTTSGDPVGGSRRRSTRSLTSAADRSRF
jgi:transposase